MLDLARIEPGCRVLDAAAGAGEPAITAASATLKPA
jgi:ubiquinone/menaquinone biosynthesis C-methylase UbiE